jgi:hypothetical protein
VLPAFFIFKEQYMMAIEQVVAFPVAEGERLEHIAHTFGARFPLQIEPLIYVLTAELAPAYDGGYWNYFGLSNGGFMMMPISDEDFAVVCENGFVGTLSAEALGITACLYAYSHLSFSGNEDLAQMCAEHYHLLREFMIDHPEAQKIMRAID